LNMVDLFGELICSDENPFNVECFEKSVSQLNKKLRKKVRYEGKSAEGCVEGGVLAKDVDIVVVDPPRKGLDGLVLQALNEGKGLKTLLYVSCGFDAFVTDCKCLEEKGGWKLVKAEGHVLFPGSDAIETLAMFVR